jgi:hypothetical protein
MDLSKLRAISNNYQDVHLLSLKDWGQSRQFDNRDQGGPYMVGQEGYDPQDTRTRYNEFVLGKSGEWVPLSIFFGLSKDQRWQEFIFSSAAEVMELMDGLPSKARIVRTGQELAPEVESAEDELNAAVIAAKEKIKTTGPGQGT